ncbi:glycoside hydrolase family 19 protein [Dickeya solani]|uniref:Glycoside hydrolase family 19 protein n=1 Tax=Dickeya solani TaxID=1089444 RepID=A0ABU4EHA2_9GAMM|nr:glycoside hydrolase family 19 protein [Dickeya solani]MCZ0823696.1 glycoside hydrolase family 19 protein [Dickeya solani]MDV6995603.1 glycoside hydrolase family 19 protein [Dickeya solani]MDV7002882.1 glycoside hydrolase family 19 protein [Dickeya solani]MDV7036658.1 glycoside hydrolase family 19 protein [Dickeya solani]MDV7043411.1 glycoside hydrolase family 19 protein [Dickeya solani]
MTQDQFMQAAGINQLIAARWYPYLLKTFAEFDITSKLEQAMFIAQVGHESGGWRDIVESFNYSAQGLQSTFGNRLTAADAVRLGRRPGENSVPRQRQVQIADAVYAYRMGNNKECDGWDYRGRGLIQITGRANYTECGTALGLDLISCPYLLERDDIAMRSAGWFWQSRGCGAAVPDVTRVTRIINGGVNGLDDRRSRFELAKRVLL